MSNSFLKGVPVAISRLHIYWDFARGENIRLEGEDEVEVMKQKTVVLWMVLLLLFTD